MATAVRLFAYAGIKAIPWSANNQLATNASYVNDEPYKAAAAITASATAQSSTTTLSPTGVTFLRVEVQKGKVIHYEITRNNATAVAATQNSPTLEGKDNLDWGPGYTISVIEDSGNA